VKVSSDRVAVFTVIENSETNLGAGSAWRKWDKSNPKSEPLEMEAIKCFFSWRKNAGWLKDCHIYCICPSKKRPKKHTITTIKDLNVQYINHYFPETEDFDCGYMNVPLVGQWFEKNYCNAYDYIVHIDLDMTVINPIPKELFYNRITVGALHERKPWSWVDHEKFKYNLESCFIISQSREMFYDRWYDKVQEININHRSEIPEKYHAEIEEYALDSLFYKYHIIYRWDILDYQFQIGERYPIRDNMNPDRVLFHHNHLYESKDVFTEYMKIRLKNSL
jgi:hypothetical protein